MSHKLVTITSNHMVRLAQYSAAIWEAVSDPMCLPGESAVVIARPIWLDNKLTMTLMLNAAYVSTSPLRRHMVRFAEKSGDIY